VSTYVSFTVTCVHMSEADSDFYVVKDAARILDVGEHRVRQMLREGELEGVRDPILDRWKIPKAAVHALREKRPTRAPEKAIEASQKGADLLSIVRDLERELGRLEGRLQITEVAESTLRDQIERERERADEERQRADGERDRANQLEEKAEKLRDELEAERSKGFWARLFGG
jgi:excisionase family DNA binding protein